MFLFCFVVCLLVCFLLQRGTSKARSLNLGYIFSRNETMLQIVTMIIVYIRRSGLSELRLPGTWGSLKIG